MGCLWSVCGLFVFDLCLMLFYTINTGVYYAVSLYFDYNQQRRI